MDDGGNSRSPTYDEFHIPDLFSSNTISFTLHGP